MSYEEEDAPSWLFSILAVLVMPAIAVISVLEGEKTSARYWLAFSVIVDGVISVAIFLKDRPLHFHNLLWSVLVVLVTYLIWSLIFFLGLCTRRCLWRTS